MASNNAKYLMLLSISMAVLMQFSSAAGLGWVLNGTIVDAGTCTAIAGANVSSPYNGNAYNISNSNGEYRLVLGTGNWTVTVSATGYSTSHFDTPYETSGGLTYNFPMLKPGETAAPNCSYFHNQETTISTTSSTTTTTTTIYTNTSTTSTAVNTSNNSSTPPNGSSSTRAIALVVVVIIVIAIAYYLVTASRKGKQHQT